MDMNESRLRGEMVRIGRLMHERGYISGGQATSAYAWTGNGFC
jgi:hypothetical protein